MHIRDLLRSLILLLLVWQGFIWAFRPPRYILPQPSDVALVFIRQAHFLFEQSLITTIEIIIGLIAGTVLGVVTALSLAAMPRLSSVVWPMIAVLQAFPAFVLAPILVLWFGFGMASKIIMTTIIIFFPIASSYCDGLRRTDPFILNVAALTKASHFQVLRYLRAPLALPSLISGLRIAATLAPLAAVIGEWVGSSQGLGFVMLQSNARMQTDMTFAAVSVVALMTVSLKAVIEFLTSPLAPWQRTLNPQTNKSTSLGLTHDH